MDIKLFNDVITGSKPIDLLSNEELAKVAHDINIVRNMMMEELTKRVPKYDVNTGAQILKLLLYAMSGEGERCRMTETEKKMLNMAKGISNYCRDRQSCSNCIFCEEPEKPNTWCTLFRIPQRWAKYIEKKEDDAE